MPGNTKHLLIWPLLAIGLYLVARTNYPLFHYLAEIFSVVIAGGIFMMAWSSRRMQWNHFLLFLGIAYLFVGVTDALHTLSYKGMGVLPHGDDNGDLAYQLRLFACYLESVSLLVAPLFLRRRLWLTPVFAIYTLIVGLLFICLLQGQFFPGWFPTGAELVRFKWANQIIICLIFVAAAVVLLYRRKDFEPRLLHLLLWSLFLSIGAELTFSDTSEGYSAANLAGHLLKIGSGFLIYKAIIEIGLMRPYDLLFRDLKRNEEQYRDLYEIAPLAFVLWDRQCRITDWNRRAEEMFGWRREEVLGKNFFELLVPEEERGRVEDVIDSLLARELPGRGTRRNLTKQGKLLLCEWNNSIQYDRDGEVMGALSLGLDITERQRAREELEKSAEQIKWFAYSITHDLKTPAVTLLGLTRRLGDKYREVLDENGRRYCEHILKGGEQIIALVDKVNTFIRTKEARPTIDSLAISELFRVVREEFAPQVTARRLNWLETETAARIRGDRLAILRALRNLVDNALKYGGPALSEIELGYDLNDRFHLLTVRDNGQGIDQQDMEQIFGMFIRKGCPKEVEGAGLGLAIVKEVAGLHQGRVWAHSGPDNKGVVFCLAISRKL
ncbi:MAG: PAS domain S-box protein [Desulfobacterales bacterium]|nr:PAS domain S-box protein [Desulfobacterales bacterium]